MVCKDCADIVPRNRANAACTSGRDSQTERRAPGAIPHISPGICMTASTDVGAWENSASTPTHPSGPTIPACAVRPSRSATNRATTPLLGNQISLAGLPRAFRTRPAANGSHRMKDRSRCRSSWGRLARIRLFGRKEGSRDIGYPVHFKDRVTSSIIKGLLPPGQSRYAPRLVRTTSDDDLFRDSNRRPASSIRRNQASECVPVAAATAPPPPTTTAAD